MADPGIFDWGGGGSPKFGSEGTVGLFCDQLRKQRRPLLSQRVNAGRRWCGEYCFANRGEQIIGGYTNRRGPRPVSTVLRKSVRFFIINIFLIKKLSRLKSGKWIGQMLHPRRMELANIPSE